MELVTPHPLLVQYLQQVQTLLPPLHRDLTPFKEAGEWHYIQSDLESNIFLLRELFERGLLPPHVQICDCGIGLGTIMFDLFLQSGEIPLQFSFFGIEKWRPYLEALRGPLAPLWQGRLETLEADLVDVDLTPYNFLWVYTPFTDGSRLMSFFERAWFSLPPGGIIVGMDHLRVKTWGSPLLIRALETAQFVKIGPIGVFIKPQTQGHTSP